MRACDIKIKCEKCGQLISRPNMSKHLRKHEKHPEDFLHPVINSTICPFCNKEFSTNSGCGVHAIYCIANPNRKTKLNGNNHLGHTAWNKGLTKADPRVAKYAEASSKSQKGKVKYYPSEETKAKISASRKKYLEAHPDQVPFKLNHSSKESYPEKYFRKWLKKVGLLEKQELQVSRYTLDFAWETKKIYLEIDGSQHSLDWMQEHDRVRTQFLAECGWTCISRVYWPDYQKLNKNQKHKYLAELKKLIKNNII